MFKRCLQSDCEKQATKWFISVIAKGPIRSLMCDKHKIEGRQYFDTKEEAQLWMIKQKL